MSRLVLLLKSLPRAPDDPYRILLEIKGYYPIFVEVLDSTPSNEEKLQAIVSSDPHGVYRGVVVTSSRSAEGWIRALEYISNCGDWSDIPFYVVGESTAHALEPMTLTHPTKFSQLLILGAQAGNAESLAHFIADDLPVRHTAGRLLYLTGDKNRDTFCRIMNEHDIPLESLMVYEPRAANGLDERITSAVQDINDNCGSNNEPVWITFFASSSSSFALPYLKQHFSLPQTGGFPLQESHALRPATLAAIGTTTSEFLTNQAHLRVDAVPIKPTAENLVASIKKLDKKLEIASM